MGKFLKSIKRNTTTASSNNGGKITVSASEIEGGDP